MSREEETRYGLTVKRASELARYEPDTGELIHLIGTTRLRVGEPLASIARKTFVQVNLPGSIQAAAHTLAWGLKTGEWPEGKIEFANGIFSDLRWVNLIRPVNLSFGPGECPNADQVRKYFNYDPLSGSLTWKTRRNGSRSSNSALTVTKKGRHQTNLGGKTFISSRIIWLWCTGEWPDSDIDHRDRDPLNETWVNLRLATNSQNQANRGLQVNNTSGYKGVVKVNNGPMPWRVMVGRVYVGKFKTLGEAHEAYGKAAKSIYGEFACLG